MNLKFKIQNSKYELNEEGFTLLELLISMTIGLIVLGSIFSSFTTQKKSYELQEQITVMEQNLRVPLDIITRDLRNAGYNPTKTLVIGTSVGIVPGTDSGVTTNIGANSIRILSNLDGAGADGLPRTTDDNSDTTGTNENVRYSFTSGDIRRNDDPLVSNIISLRFKYYDATGTEITALPITAAANFNLSNIRLVEVSITARTEREDTTYTTAEDVNGNGVLDAGEDLNGNETIDGVNISGTTADGGCRTRTLTAKVRTRNIGLQSP